MCCYQSEQQNIAFFSEDWASQQRNYTTTEKELLAIVEFPKQFLGIIFD